MIPFAYLCHRLLSSAFVRFWLLASPRLLISRFSFVRTPPVETTQGVFLSPETFPRKIFPKIFFKSTQGDFLLIFWREFVMRGKAACSLPMGGVPLFCGLVGLSLPFFRFPFPRSFFPCGLPFPIGWQHRGGSGTIGAAGPVVFLVLLGGAWLPCLGPASVLSGASGPPATGAKRLKIG